MLPSAVFVGYFPKITVTKPAWLENQMVLEIGSVSECFSAGPTDWILAWQHNTLGFFDTEAQASALTQEYPERYDIYAYKLYPYNCLDGQPQAIDISPVAGILPQAYAFLGYDVVSKSSTDFFECSPLSCNNAASDYAVNEYCLIEDRQTAFAAWQAICHANLYEPGPYYLFEVYRKARLSP